VGRSSSTILGGAALFALAASGALMVLLFHRTEPRRFALAGNALVIVGVAIVLWSVTDTSVAGFFIGTVIAGAGFGAGFQGGLRTIVTLAGPAERAGVISVAYIICYLAMGLPAILAGFLVVNSTVTRTAQEFGITVIALATVTAVGTILSARRIARQRCLSPSPAK
jgi:MFS family permease